MGALRQQMRRGQPRQPCRQRRLHRLGGQIPPHGDAAARRHRRRIPEALLLAFAACFGSLGVLAGMYLCRHKTRKPLFTVTVPLLLLAQCTILYFLFR